jgi:hypothetical protein
MKRRNVKSYGLVALLVATANLVHANTVLFQDDFESGTLDQWIGKSGEPHQGQIVTDPLNASNQVLSFTGVNAAGDIFSAAKLDVSKPRQYILSFDFLGLSAGGAPVENGGFIGIADAPSAASSQFWLGGTYPAALSVPPSVATTLVVDGQWHHYEINFTEVILAHQLSGAHLMLEDWIDLGSVPGDAFFDNVQVVGGFDLGIFTELVPCAGPAPGTKWENHGDYVSTMSKVVGSHLKAGIITQEEADAVMSAAGESDCGKRK